MPVRRPCAGRLHRRSRRGIRCTAAGRRSPGPPPCSEWSRWSILAPSLGRITDGAALPAGDARLAGRAARRPAVRTAMRCGPVTFPNYRLVPDSRWHLDARAPRRALGAAPPERRGGVRAHPQGAAPDRLRRRRVADHVNVPEPRLRAHRRNGASSAYAAAALDRRPLDPQGLQALPQRPVLPCARLRERPRAQLEVRPRRARRRCARSASIHASGASAIVTARSQVRTPGQVGRDRAAAEPRVLEDPLRAARVSLNSACSKGTMPTSAHSISRAASSSERRPSQTRFGARAAGLEVGIARTRPRAARRSAAARARASARRARAAAPSRCGGRDGRARPRRPSADGSGAGNESCGAR